MPKCDAILDGNLRIGLDDCVYEYNPPELFLRRQYYQLSARYGGRLQQAALFYILGIIPRARLLDVPLGFNKAQRRSEAHHLLETGIDLSSKTIEWSDTRSASTFVFADGHSKARKFNRSTYATGAYIRLTILSRQNLYPYGIRPRVMIISNFVRLLLPLGRL